MDAAESAFAVKLVEKANLYRDRSRKPASPIDEPACWKASMAYSLRQIPRAASQYRKRR